MEELILLSGLFFLVLVVGCICGFIALAKVSNLKRDIAVLTNQVNRLLGNTQTKPSLFIEEPAIDSEEINKPETLRQNPVSEYSHQPEKISAPTPTQEESATQPEHSDDTPPQTVQQAEEPAQIQPTREQIDTGLTTEKLWHKLKDNWLVWVGGLALAFGGVFLVNYALASGWLSPMMRLCLGAVFGVGLIAGAEYLHKKNITFEGFANYVPATLAGGGFISLFALTLTALLRYQFISPSLAFVALAIIAITASWYAVRFGPILAVLGILGAYSVPLWITSSTPQWGFVLAYIGLVSLSATLVAKKVGRAWLWYIIWGAHFAWLALAFFKPYEPLLYGNDIYLPIFIVFSIWLLIIVPKLGLMMRQGAQHAHSLPDLIKQWPDHPILIALLGFTAYYIATPLYPAMSMMGLALVSIPLLIAPNRNSAWDGWPLTIIPLLAVLMFTTDMPNTELTLFIGTQGALGFALLMSLILFIYGLLFANKYANPQCTGAQNAKDNEEMPKQRLSFTVLASGAIFSGVGLSYANVSAPVLSSIYPFWCVILFISAGVLIWQAQRSNHLLQQFCYWCGANANIALGFTLVFEKTALTLALTAQLLAMSWLIKRHDVPMPKWPIKLLVAGLLLRMSIAPWQLDYKTLYIGPIHWTTLIFPVMILAFYIATRFWKKGSDMQRWLHGALLHLIALFVTTQISLFMVGHMPSLTNLSTFEEIVLSLSWMLVGCIYLYRQNASHSAAIIYTCAGIGLLCLAFALQAHLLFTANPWFNNMIIGAIFSGWLWLLWGAPILTLAWLYKNTHLLPAVASSKNTKLFLSIGMAFFAVLLINALIRQFWKGNDMALINGTSDAELYSYSVVWLLIGAGLVVFSQVKHKALMQKVGLGVLGIVVAKVFLIDMANLEGLMRALSFLGLGGCLVGLGWLFQWLRANQKPSD